MYEKPVELWRPVTGSNGLIEVSNFGRVRSLLKGKPTILKTSKDRAGYHRFTATIEHQRITSLVHRAVAKEFIPNPTNRPEVNHKDGNKGNNAVENLEWVTRMENVRHAIENGLWDSVFEGTRRENEKRKRPVIGYFTSETYCCSRRFDSVSEADRFIGSHHVADVAKGKKNSVKGWTFRYENE